MFLMHELRIDTAPEESLTRLMWVRNSSHKLQWEVLETEIGVYLNITGRKKVLVLKFIAWICPLYFGHVTVLSFPIASDFSFSQPSSTSVMWRPGTFPKQTSSCPAGLSSYSTVPLSSLGRSPLRCHKLTWFINTVLLWSVLLHLHKLHFSHAACSASGW